ncbi:hypothetical protein J2751_002276 [Halorubrum alkaliphilum]|uniref:Uncharacterized protein n=1 Tax=Halorubrum alkaliphilum TaxID=261290 RepID=A0A8T4GHP8_9EURY|nr:hypothetical protein [Halorubrum alkaliphilum]
MLGGLTLVSQRSPTYEIFTNSESREVIHDLMPFHSPQQGRSTTTSTHYATLSSTYTYPYRINTSRTKTEIIQRTIDIYRYNR